MHLAGGSLVLRSNESRLDIGTGLIKILYAKQRRGCYWGCKKNHFCKIFKGIVSYSNAISAVLGSAFDGSCELAEKQVGPEIIAALKGSFGFMWQAL